MESLGCRSDGSVVTALFHDSAKPITTVQEWDRDVCDHPTTPQGEQLVGRAAGSGVPLRKCASAVWGLCVTRAGQYFGERAVAPNVRSFGCPGWTENRLLYLFALADSRGRDHEFDEELDNLTLETSGERTSALTDDIRFRVSDHLG